MIKNDIDELEVGDWCFINGETHIGIRLGKGETDICILPIQNKDSPREIQGVHWNWNGDRNSPTITPSILHWGNGRKLLATWHGYLTNGNLVEV